MSNPQITPIDLSQIPVFPECPSAPKEILLNILSFLTEKEHLIASYVCHKWRAEITTSALRKNLTAKTHLKVLLEEGKLTDLFNVEAPPFTELFSVNQDVCILQQNGLRRVDKTGKSESIPDSQLILADVGNFALISKSSNTAACLDKKEGSILFTIEPKKFELLNTLNKKAGERENTLNFLQAFIVCEDSLTIVAVLQSDILAKWTVKEGTPQLTHAVKLETEEKMPYAVIDKQFLYMGCETSRGFSYSIYALTDLKKVGSPPDPRALMEFMLSDKYNKYVVGDQLLCTNGYKMRSFDLQRGTLTWAQDGYHTYPYIFLSASDKWIAFSTYNSQTSNINFVICDAANGNKKEYQFASSIQNAKIYDSLIIVATRQCIFAYNLEEDNLTKNIIGFWNLPKGETMSLLSVHFAGSKLFLYLSDGLNVFVKVLSFLGRSPEKWKVEPPKSSMIQQRIVEKKAPPAMQPPVPVGPHSSYKKTTTIALGILTVLLISGALASYFSGSINLSIGLGVASLLSLGGVLIAGLNTKPILAKGSYV